MLKYFDKTFFKFLIGFIALIAVSFVVNIFMNLYLVGEKIELSSENQSQNQSGGVVQK